jgi:putative PIN family toxin of toxin-antitoxin system
MKVFFDTNVYVAEGLLGGAAIELVEVTVRLRWRILSSLYVLEETERVLVEKLGFSRRLGVLTRERVRRRAQLTPNAASRHQVPSDPADNPILAIAIAAGSDFLVTNDAHLLALDPYLGLRIISMTDYYQLLVDQGHISA